MGFLFHDVSKEANDRIQPHWSESNEQGNFLKVVLWEKHIEDVNIKQVNNIAKDYCLHFIIEHMAMTISVRNNKL